jgi:hypothetical protein
MGLQPLRHITTENIRDTLLKKALRKKEHVSNKLIIAWGVDHKGKVVCIKHNIPPIGKESGKGKGQHAEERIIKCVNPLELRAIYIAQLKFTSRGKCFIVPKEPCKKCQELADKYNIELIPYVQ